MLRNFCKFLPVFIVVFLARAKCEIVYLNDQKWYSAFDNVLIRGK